MTVSKKKIHAPYNFVPLSGWIYQPAWADQVSRDMPFSDGINGEINIRIKAHSPFLVGGAQKAGDDKKPGEVFPFKTADGECGIPGSTLKGMTRALMSIISFGKMRQVDDQWLSIRDLTPGAADIYRKRIQEPKAGYLRLNGQGKDSRWEIVPCKYLSVSHADLVDLAEDLGFDEPEGIKEEQKSPSKYKRWKASLKVTFSNHIQDNSFTNGEPAHDLKACQKDSKVQRETGRLVFTGQPQKNDGKRGRKKREFIFCHPDQDHPVTIDPEVIRAFLHIHSHTDEWEYHTVEGKQKLGVPVFYIEESGDPKAIGLAFMFRLAYENSIGKAIDQTNSRHRDSETLDLPEILFGHINENETGMAGRVSFSTARRVGEAEEDEPFVAILNSPKPSYYPSYIQQKPGHEGRIAGSAYQTLMNDAEIRGWKRYPARPTEPLRCTEADENTNDQVKMKLHPLKSGSTFEAKVRIHNVRSLEFGALLWCLTWAGKPNLRHGLGMGKPFGMGKVSIEVDEDSWQLYRNDGEPIGQVSDYIKDFEQEMDRHYRKEAIEQKGEEQGWHDSEQLVQLLAMANPACANGQPESLEYMPLPKHLDMKKTFQYLLPYTKYKGFTDDRVFTKRKPHERTAHEKRMRKIREEEAAAQAREAALAHLPELERQVSNDLQKLKGQPAENKAQEWYQELKKREGDEAVQIARPLRTYYQSLDNKWHGSPGKKQRDKIAKIKAVLAAGGDHVSE